MFPSVIEGVKHESIVQFKLSHQDKIFFEKLPIFVEKGKDFEIAGFMESLLLPKCKSGSR